MVNIFQAILNIFAVVSSLKQITIFVEISAWVEPKFHSVAATVTFSNSLAAIKTRIKNRNINMLDHRQFYSMSNVTHNAIVGHNNNGFLWNKATNEAQTEAELTSQN